MELYLDTAVEQLKWLVPGFPPRRPGFKPRSGHVRFVVEKVALGQVSISPANSHSIDCSILIIYHPALLQ
jgi:hypothetical protein